MMEFINIIDELAKSFKTTCKIIRIHSANHGLGSQKSFLIRFVDFALFLFLLFPPIWYIVQILLMVGRA